LHESPEAYIKWILIELQSICVQDYHHDIAHLKLDKSQLSKVCCDPQTMFAVDASEKATGIGQLVGEGRISWEIHQYLEVAILRQQAACSTSNYLFDADDGARFARNLSVLRTVINTLSS